MSFISNYRADRLIAEIKSSGNAAGPNGQKALAKLVAIGPGAIGPIVAALGSAEKQEMMVFVDALSQLADVKTLPTLVALLGENKGRTASGISWALSTSINFPAQALLEALAKPGAPRPALIEVIAAQKGRFSARELLSAAFSLGLNPAAGSSRHSSFGSVASARAISRRR